MYELAKQRYVRRVLLYEKLYADYDDNNTVCYKDDKSITFCFFKTVIKVKWQDCKNLNHFHSDSIQLPTSVFMKKKVYLCDPP